MLALDKPGDLYLLADPLDGSRPCLMDLLHGAIAAGKPWAKEPGRFWLKNAHRIDDEASGVVVLAKNKTVLAALQDAFGAEKPGRNYLALVQGGPIEDQFEIDAAIAPHPVRPRIMRVDLRQGKASRTVVTVLERFFRWTLVRCQALTDRPHQIRLHLRHSALAVVGDPAYGGRPLLLSRLKPGFRLKPNREERPLISLPALHCESLVFEHPVTGQPLTITAPWPKDLTVAVKYLRRYATGAASAGLP